ncbi:hypothetical protein L3X38_013958 [Prunus dulcis]|uniref:MATH domain-containing protein n=1 Tax=Prunus dulcis TaxID=3755 RepID=A0AAD4WMF8_PRUDU|nr:hypothetical protein L3X38_013958 [Prunus dulcis]
MKWQDNFMNGLIAPEKAQGGAPAPPVAREVHYKSWNCTSVSETRCTAPVRRNAQTNILIAGILRTISDAPPTHYTIKIQSLSLLSVHSLEKYESGVFEAGGYKWKLVFYPNGNKSRNVKEHISLYLVLAGANAPRLVGKCMLLSGCFCLIRILASTWLFKKKMKGASMG